MLREGNIFLLVVEGVLFIYLFNLILYVISCKVDKKLEIYNGQRLSIRARSVIIGFQNKWSVLMCKKESLTLTLVKLILFSVCTAQVPIFAIFHVRPDIGRFYKYD